MRDRDDSGAVAVLFAGLALVLLGVSALAVDIGQVYAKRSALQTNVDLAVLAATAELTTDGACNAEVVTKAQQYLTRSGNVVPNQAPINLTDGDSSNGFIQCADWRVELSAPRSHVDYGLAGAVMDKEAAAAGVDVPAYAAASVMSPKMATLPMYIAQSCISGSQIQITDPPKGHSDALDAPDFPETGATTPLKFSNSWSDTRFLDEDIAAGNTAIKVQLQGSKYELGDVITFTSHDDLATTYTHSVSSADVASNQTTFDLPSEVAASSGIWWVRISRGGVFMQDTEARAITVGDIGLCNGSLSGNFGTLTLARSEPSHELVKNIILGAEPILAINGNPTTIPCPVAQSETSPNSPTDCVSTKPGFAGSELTQGLILGLGSEGLKGRLDAPTTPGCSRSGSDSRTPGDFALNDDTIACYLINGKTLPNALHPSTTTDALSGEIVASPRFFRIPVLPEDPSHGTSTNYPILGYRYVFITTEGSSSISGYNGITMRTNGTRILTLSVAVLNDQALPDTVPNPGEVIEYTGSGPKVVVLVE